MKEIHARDTARNTQQSPLNQNAAHERRVHYAVAWLRRRHPLSPERARLIANVAGLSIDRGY
jgi:hypothetical protein